MILTSNILDWLRLEFKVGDVWIVRCNCILICLGMNVSGYVILPDESREVPSRLRGFLLGIVYVNFIIFMLLLLLKS